MITTLGNAGWFWIVLAVLMLTVLPKKYKKAGLTMAIALILSLYSVMDNEASMGKTKSILGSWTEFCCWQ